MILNIPAPNALVHHILKVAVPLTLGAVASLQTEIHWALKILAGVPLVAGLLGIAFAMEHAKRLCSRCKPTKHPARWHNRAWAAFGRHGGLPLIAALMTAAVLMSLFAEPLSKNREDDPARLAITSTLVIVLALYVAARRFNNVNHPDRPTGSPVAAFFAGRGKGLVHHSDRLSIAAAAIAALLSFAPPQAPWSSARMASSLLLFVAIEAAHRHSMAPCAECAAAFRVDAADYAAARAWRFKAAHRNQAVIIALILILFGVSFFLKGIALGLVLTVVYGVFAVYTLTDRFHSAYRPWCPMCRGGGGGDDECEVHPTPTGDNGRPVPVT